MGWGIADQSISSLTNFALGILIARAVTTAEFGAFGIAFSTYLIALGISRAVAAEPLVIRYSVGPSDRWARGSRAATGTALLLASVFALLCLAAGLLAQGPLRGALIALAICLPGLILQDIWRYAFFAAGRGSRAFINDVCWMSIMFPAILLFVGLDLNSAGWMILAWGGAGTAAALIGCFQARLLPRPQAARGWLHEHKDIAGRYVGEFMASGGAAQLTTYGVGAIAGLAATGTLRAGALLMGPLNVLFMGIRLSAIPEGVRLLKESVGRLRQRSLGLSSALGAGALIWVMVIVFAPDAAGRAILRDNWEPAQRVVLQLGLGMVGSGLVAGASVGLRALAAARRSFRASLAETAVNVVFILLGAAVSGAVGAAWGIAGAGVFGVVVWWVYYSKALDEHAGGRDSQMADPITDLPEGV
jgi:O-antigen/teichoic acid export membrane protein